LYLDLWKPTISYSLDKDDYLVKAEGSNTAVYTVPGFPFYIHDLSVVFTLPRGGEYISAQPAPVSTEKTGSKIEVVFNLGSRVPYDEPEVSLGYTVSPLASYIQPLGILLVLAIVIGVIYFTRRREHRVVEKKVIAEKPRIASYLANYLERITLLNEHIQILEDEESEADEKVQRLAEINRRQGQLERSLKEMGKALEDDEPDLSEYLRQIRRAEEEASKVNEDLRNLDVRLRARRISRRDHQRRRESRLNRQREAIRRIEKAISDIQASV
jgi:tetratricopeptide (TPR) repeat protein